MISSHNPLGTFQNLQLVAKYGIRFHQHGRSFENDPSLILGGSHAIGLGLWLRFHQQVVDREPAEQETLPILLSHRNIRAPVLPQSGRGIDGPIQIAEDFPLPILEAIAERRVENSLEEALDLTG